MPRKRRTSILMLAVALLILLVLGLSGDEGAVPMETLLGEPVPGIDAAREAFKEMDNLLDMVIEWYEEEVIFDVATSQDAAQLKGYVALLHKYKKKVIMSMPDYLGIPFWEWHDDFNAINGMLDDVDDAAAGADGIQRNQEFIGNWLERVRDRKENMENSLPDQSE